MSYILDALKRADAERERGAVPGLHARQLTAPALPADRRTPYRIGLAAAAVLALGGIAGGLWVWQMPAAGNGRPAAVEPASAPAPAPGPALVPVPVPPAQPVPAPLPTPVPVPPALPPVEKPAVSRPVPKPARPAAPAAAASPAARPDAVAKAPARAAPGAVPLLGELPDSMRRQIPSLAISGSVYSKNPAQRLLLVNNQVLSQGSLVAPGVSLEEIQTKSSVFSFRGTRFRVLH